jgi:penicillin-binding protein 2
MSPFVDSESQLASFRTRVLVAGVLVLLAFGVLAARMAYLQIGKYEELQVQAESNRTAVVPVVPDRGLIVDRHGVVLASNYSAYTLEITPALVQDMNSTLAALSEIVQITERDIRRFQRLLEEGRRFESLPLRIRLTEEEVARFAVQRYRFEGVDIRARLLRHYPLGDTASHVVGYIGRINQREKEQISDWPEDQQANYRGTEYIGKLGIEQTYEDALHGRTGFERVETTAGGRAMRTLASTAALRGDTVALTIDIKLQKLVEDMFGQRRGALVAIDPRNGEVLALVSKPTFDPNLFVEGIDVENWRALNESIDRPLVNRAMRGTYPPGSTYKPFMALAALHTGTRNAHTTINDPGFWMLGSHRFRSHNETSLGPVDLRRSIVRSSNTYYYTLAHEMGVDAIHDFMQPLGFGQITGIDLRGEVRGILPSQQWKRTHYKTPEHQRWYPGETISVGIGQGYNSFTMLQVAHAMATVANGGVKFKPRITSFTQGADGSATTATGKPPEGQPLGYKPEHVRQILEAMEAVTTEGTSARVFAGAPYRSGGKTGTAQAVTIGQRERYDAKKLEEHQRDHSLYVAFAPVEEPRIALAVIVENAGFGSAHAAPIARRVFDYVLLDQYPSEADLAAVSQGQALAPIGQPRLASQVEWPPAP